MSSDRPRPRKVNPQPRAEWRVKRTDSAPIKKYDRCQLLSQYAPAHAPEFLQPLELLEEVFLPEAEGPVSRADAVFEHHLGEDIGARERQPANLPAWYSESAPTDKRPALDDKPKEPAPDLQKRPSTEAPAKLPEPPKPSESAPRPVKVVLAKNAVVRNLPKDLEVFDLKVETKPLPQSTLDFEEDFYAEEYSQIDRELERRLKRDEDTEESVPEWAALPTHPVTAASPAASPVLPSPLKATAVQATSPAVPSSQPAKTGTAVTVVSQVSPQTVKNSPAAVTSPGIPSPQISKSSDETQFTAFIQPAAQQPASPDRPKSFPQVSIPLFDSTPVKFRIDLLQERIKDSDPFAKVIFQHGVPDSQGYMLCIPLSAPLERAWLYKDSKGTVQGPFTSIEMYNWNLIGVLAQGVTVAWRSPGAFLPIGDLQGAPAEFWNGEQDMVEAFKPAMPASPPKPVKQTLEINPGQAVRSVLGIDSHKRTSSGWVVKSKDANRKR